MAQVVIKGSEKAIQLFCDWFSNSGEQGLMDCWADVSETSYLGTSGYTGDIELIEYDNETHEEVPYVD